MATTDMPPTLTCPIDGCDHQLPARARPMCLTHWMIVPPAIRVQVTLAYSQWRSCSIANWQRTWIEYTQVRQYAVTLAENHLKETEPIA